MRQTLQILLVLFFINTRAASVEVTPGSISGRLLDHTDHTPLANANVIVAGSSAATITDTSGYFIIREIKHGAYNVEARKLGYHSQVISDVIVNPGRLTEVEFLLEPAAIQSSEVIVKRGYFYRSPDLPTSNRTLRSEEVRRAPGGAEDIQRVIQALPGVAGANDQTNEIVVRGGSPFENLTLIDGIEIDNVNHFPTQSSSGGPISALNVSFLKDVSFSTGGFSARYGDRASSIMALELRDGDRNEWHTEAELSMAGAGIEFEGPLAEGQGTFIGSLRRSYLSLIQGAIGLTAVPNYYDGQIRASWDFSPTTKGSLYSIYTHDWINIEAEEPDAWTRGAETVRAKYSRYVVGGRVRFVRSWGLGDVVVARTSTSFDERVIEMPQNTLTYRNDATETIDQVHLNLSGKVAGSDEWSAGISMKPIQYDYNNWFDPETTFYDFNSDGVLDTTVVTPPWGADRTMNTLKTAGYAQYRWKPLPHLMVTGGLRHDMLMVSTRQTLAPRLALQLDLPHGAALSLATGVYYQSLPLFYLTWDPDGKNEDLPPMRANHYIVGLSKEFGEGTITSVEGFYKEYSKIPVEEEDIRRVEDPMFRSWRYLSIGTKTAYGLEFFLQQKKIDDWYGTFSYSIGKSNSYNTLRVKPADYDFRHVATVVAGKDFSLIEQDWFRDLQSNWYGWWTYVLPLNGDVVTLSSRYRFVSGRPFTPRIWITRPPEMGYRWVDSADDNSARYPDYMRWDVRWDSKWYSGGKSVTVFMEVQNVTNRANVAQYIYSDDNPEMDTAYQFGFFFVGGVRIGF